MQGMGDPKDTQDFYFSLFLRYNRNMQIKDLEINGIPVFDTAEKRDWLKKELAQLKKSNSGADFYIGNRKTPFTRLTPASSQLFDLLKEDLPEGSTYRDIYQAINFDDELKTAVAYFIFKGYGSHTLDDLSAFN